MLFLVDLSCLNDFIIGDGGIDFKKFVIVWSWRLDSFCLEFVLRVKYFLDNLILFENL